MIKIKKQKNLRTVVAAFFGEVVQVMPRINHTCYICILEPQSLQACCRERGPTIVSNTWTLKLQCITLFIKYLILP